MGRGNGSKSKLKGRVSGYETADFTIAKNTTKNSTYHKNSVKTPPVYKGNQEVRIFKKIGKGIICVIAVVIGLLGLLIAVVSKTDKSNNEYDSTYVEPKIITPESSDIKPTAFTQRQLDAQYARDNKIAEVLSKDWIITDNARASNYYITVGKRWESISSNKSPILRVRTSYEYDPADQSYETSSLRIDLQEIKAGVGIIVDPTVVNLLNIYDPSINIESIKSYVQTAYDTTSNSNSYEGKLSFDKNRIYINGSKSGQLINVTIDCNISISIN